MTEVLVTDEDAIDKAIDEFLLQYGRTLAAWAWIEEMMGFWHMEVSNLPRLEARAMFFGLNGPRNRVEKLRKDASEAPLSKISADELRALLAILDRVGDYIPTRNLLAHGLPRVSISHGIGARYEWTHGGDVPGDPSATVLLIESLPPIETAFKNVSGALYQLWNDRDRIAAGEPPRDTIDGYVASMVAMPSLPKVPRR